LKLQSLKLWYGLWNEVQDQAELPGNLQGITLEQIN
jgi:hypothetical protein